MVDNRCVVCGEIIPEGRQVCPTCEVMSNKEIEELATELYTLFQSRPMSKAMARHLYDKGWRKQKEGEWKDQYQGMYANQLYKCSVCGETAFHDDKRWFLTNFCPNCGAKMKGGAE